MISYSVMGGSLYEERYSKTDNYKPQSAPIVPQFDNDFALIQMAADRCPRYEAKSTFLVDFLSKMNENRFAFEFKRNPGASPSA